MSRGVRIAWAVALALLVAGFGSVFALKRYQARSVDPDFWVDDIAAFAEADAETPPVPGGIVFTGSSSIRLWDGLAEDMAPLPVLNRGFGGSHLAHVVHYYERLIYVHEPRAVVVYAGDNDLSSGGGKTVEDVVAAYDALDRLVRRTLPEAHLYFIAIKPSKLRIDRWPEMERANAAIEKRCNATPRRTYLDVATPMLGPDGQPRRELFVFDGLHLSDEGYALWTEVVRSRLLADWEAAEASN